MAKNTDQPESVTPEQVYARNKIAYGSPEHQRLLESGYGMTVEKAKTIIKERKENPQLWPYEVFEQAEKLLAALNAVPVAIDQKPGWHRTRVE